MDRNLLKIESLVGLQFMFHGVDNNCLFLSLEGTKTFGFEVLEDPDDGYRSSMDSVRLIHDTYGKHVFFATPIAEVVLVSIEDTDFVGYDLVDVKTGHVWLRFGTDHQDNYYPFFVFDYTVDSEKTVVTGV